MWRQYIVALVLGAAIAGITLVGPVSCGSAVAQGFVEGLDDLDRSGRNHVGADRDSSSDFIDRDPHRDGQDRHVTDRDGCRGGSGVEGLDCNGRGHRRDHRNADHDDHWRQEWRNFDPSHSNGLDSGNVSGSHGRGQWHRGSRGFEPPLRDYGGGDFDGAPRGMGLPYWAPD